MQQITIGHLGHFLLNFFWTQGTLRHILGPILVVFEICHLMISGLFEYFSEMGAFGESRFSWWRSDCYPLIGLVLGGQAKSWAKFDSQSKRLKGCHRPSKVKYHFFWHIDERLKHTYYWGVASRISLAYGALLNLFWTFEYLTAGPFVGCKVPIFQMFFNKDFWPFVFWFSVINWHKSVNICQFG